MGAGGDITTPVPTWSSTGAAFAPRHAGEMARAEAQSRATGGDILTVKIPFTLPALATRGDVWCDGAADSRLVPKPAPVREATNQAQEAQAAQQAQRAQRAQEAQEAQGTQAVEAVEAAEAAGATEAAERGRPGGKRPPSKRRRGDRRELSPCGARAKRSRASKRVSWATKLELTFELEQETRADDDKPETRRPVLPYSDKLDYLVPFDGHDAWMKEVSFCDESRGKLPQTIEIPASLNFSELL